MRRFICALIGHKPLNLPNAKTLVLSYRGEACPGRVMTFHYEPCFRCRNLVLVAYTNDPDTTTTPVDLASLEINL